MNWMWKSNVGQFGDTKWIFSQIMNYMDDEANEEPKRKYGDHMASCRKSGRDHHANFKLTTSPFFKEIQYLDA